jgi:hypothetical protein
MLMLMGHDHGSIIVGLVIQYTLPPHRLHFNANHIYVFLFWEWRGLSPNFHIRVFEGFIYSQDRSTYSPAAELANLSWIYINLSKIYECRNWETEHYNSILEITALFLGIHEWEPDIYNGFSPDLHLQCDVPAELFLSLPLQLPLDSILKLLRSPGIDSASLCSLEGWYDNPIPTRFLAPKDCSKILTWYQLFI